jgi:hypothetical protein
MQQKTSSASDVLAKDEDDEDYDDAAALARIARNKKS